VIVEAGEGGSVMVEAGGGGSVMVTAAGVLVTVAVRQFEAVVEAVSTL
jgi:hypothetical protein